MWGCRLHTCGEGVSVGVGVGVSWGVGVGVSVCVSVGVLTVQTLACCPAS